MCLMARAARPALTCPLRTTSGRKRKAAATAAAFRSAPADSGRPAGGRGTRSVRRPASRSNSPAPGELRVITQASTVRQFDTSRCIRSWIPPNAGGKSGVRTSALTRSGCVGDKPVEPGPEREQRPKDATPVHSAVQVLAHERSDRVTIEPAFSVEGAGTELLLEHGRER